MKNRMQVLTAPSFIMPFRSGFNIRLTYTGAVRKTDKDCCF